MRPGTPNRHFDIQDKEEIGDTIPAIMSLGDRINQANTMAENSGNSATANTGTSLGP